MARRRDSAWPSSPSAERGIGCGRGRREFRPGITARETNRNVASGALPDVRESVPPSVSVEDLVNDFY
jgi:hypothetical protein